MTLPFVTIVVPALNEAAYIEACLESLLEQWPGDACEILVMDGGSTDCTPALVAAMAGRHPRVSLVRNPRRIQSAAVNLAAEMASPLATVLVRADAHALYAPDFVRRCVEALLAQGATSVVVPMRTQAQGQAQPGARPRAFLQHAFAAAQSSRLGNGGSAHRVGGMSGFVEHGHHAAFDLRFFRAVGGYDESFTHNEDAELDVRALRAGGRIWMCAEAPVIYYPRDRFDRLAHQYFRHGGGRARTLRKHALRPRPRQMLPLAVLGGLITGLAAAPFLPELGALALLYPAICLGWGVTEMVRRRDARLAAAGAALMTMHLAWAMGFLFGFARTRSAGFTPLRVPLPLLLRSDPTADHG